MQRFFTLAAWWHLLSLDAPSVATLWALFFAHAMHIQLPLLQAVLLGLGTWLLYAADRILDGLGRHPAAWLRERHHFHARHRNFFLLTGLVVLPVLAWLVYTRMRPDVFEDDLWLGACTLLYLGAVHRGSNSAKPLFPKEVAVAVLFSLATAVPAWARLSGVAFSRLSKEELAPAVICFGLLCWINCVGIEKWESTGPLPRGRVHWTTRWASLHLRSIVTAVALFACLAAWFSPSRGLMAVYVAVFSSSSLLLALDARSANFSPFSLRVAADAALLTPLALLPFAR